MLAKIHQSYRTVVAICDSELLGKTFEEGIKILEVRESFYNGDEFEEKKLIEFMVDQAKEDATFCIAGSNSVQAALKAGIIKEEGIAKIQDIPFALVLM